MTRALALPAALLVLWGLAPAFLLPLLPGLLLRVTPLAGRLEAPVLAVHVVTLSCAFWMAGFWALRWLPIPLEAGFRGASLLAIVALAGLRVRSPSALVAPGRLDSDRLDWTLLAVLFGGAMALRAVPLFQTIVAAGADMSMHTYITALLATTDTVPASYEPLLAIDRFDAFPVGFHTLAALIAQLSELPPYRASYLLAMASHALLTPALYAAARPGASRGAALLAALTFSFLVMQPQRFITWGGNPTVFAIAFAAVFASTLSRFERWDRWDLLLAAGSLSAALLVHTIVFVQTCYLVGIPLALIQLSRARREPAGLVCGAALLLACAAISLPYLSAIDPGLASTEAKDWIRLWIRRTSAWHGSLGDALWSVPLFLVRKQGDRLFAYLPLVVLGAWRLWRLDRESVLRQLGFLLIACLLIVNTQHWWLPLSFLVYPDRVVAMLPIPLAILFAGGVDALPALWRRTAAWPGQQRMATGALLAAGLVTIAVVAGAGFRRFYVDRFLLRHLDYRSVFESDLEAIRWLAEHSRPDDKVHTNYGDSGAWIPGIALRGATDTHINVAILHLHKSPANPRFAFVGSTCVYEDNCSLTAEDLDADPAWARVHGSGGAVVFERIPIE